MSFIHGVYRGLCIVYDRVRELVTGQSREKLDDQNDSLISLGKAVNSIPDVEPNDTEVMKAFIIHQTHPVQRGYRAVRRRVRRSYSK